MDLRSLHEMIYPAVERVKPYVRHTDLLFSKSLSAECGAEVYLKLESEQVTGSFKFRGVLNKLSCLLEENKYSPGTPPVTASSGNGALACTHASKLLDMDCKILVPENVAANKKDKLIKAGANLIYYGTDCCETEMKARQIAEETSAHYISPYNDYAMIAGHSSLAAEIIEDLPDVDAVFASCGGGGLLSAMVAFFKVVKPDVRIVSCQPVRSKVMYESVRAGKIIEEESFETLSDGTAGGVEDGTVTFELLKNYIDEWVLVEEQDIAKGIADVLLHENKTIEGAAGVVVAALRQVASNYFGKKVVLVICGSNISEETLTQALTLNKRNHQH